MALVSNIPGMTQAGAKPEHCPPPPPSSPPSPPSRDGRRRVSFLSGFVHTGLSSLSSALRGASPALSATVRSGRALFGSRARPAHHGPVMLFSWALLPVPPPAGPWPPLHPALVPSPFLLLTTFVQNFLWVKTLMSEHFEG